MGNENYFRRHEDPPAFTRAKEIIEGAGLEFKGMPSWLVENSASESLKRLKSQKTITEEDGLALFALQNKGYFPQPGSGPKLSDMVRESESEARAGIVRDTAVPAATAIYDAATGGAILGPVGAIGKPILAPIARSAMTEFAAPPITGQDGTMYMGDGTPAGASGRHPSEWSTDDLIRQARISGGANPEVMEELQRRENRRRIVYDSAPEGITDEQYQGIQDSIRRQAALMGKPLYGEKGGSQPPSEDFPDDYDGVVVPRGGFESLGYTRHPVTNKWVR